MNRRLLASAAAVTVSLASALAVCGASPAVSAPPKLPRGFVALEAKMAQLHINSERGTVVVSISGLSLGGGTGLFEATPGRRSGRASEVELLEADAPLRLPLAPPLNIPLITADFELSVSPRLGLVRAEILGVLPLQVRLIGERTYVRSPLLDLLDLGDHGPIKPWVLESEAERAAERSGKKAEGSSPLPSVGEPDGGFGKLLASLAKARSIVEVGPAVVDGQRTTEFKAKLERMVRGSKGSARPGSAKGAKSRLKRLRETLYLYLASNGLPVRVTDQAQVGKARLDASVDTLETEIPISVQPPPASETITKAELEKLEEKESGGGLRPLTKQQIAEQRRFIACARKRLGRHPGKARKRKLNKTLHECERIAERGAR